MSGVAGSCGIEPNTFATGLGAGDPVVTAQLQPAGSDRRFDLILDAGDQVQVDVGMLDFDPTVELLDASATSLGRNDDGPFGLDSQLIATATISGFHTVVVSSVDPGGCGLFNVSVTIIGTGVSTTLPAPSPPSVENFFTTLGATVELVEVDLVAGDRLLLILLDGGDGTDPFIAMTDPVGAPFGSDDNSGSASGGPLDAQVEVTATITGTYSVFIRSNNGVSGPAQVSIIIN